MYDVNRFTWIPYCYLFILFDVKLFFYYREGEKDNSFRLIKKIKSMLD